MSTPGMSHQRCAGALILALGTLSCLQQPLRGRVPRIPIPPREASATTEGTPEARPQPRPNSADGTPQRTDSPSAVSRDDEVVATEMDTRAALEPAAVAPQAPKSGAPVSAADEPFTLRPPEPARDPVQPPDERVAPGVELQGRVVSRTTGLPPRAGQAMVVLAFSDDRAADSEAAADLPALIVRRGALGMASTFVVSSPGREVRFENGDDICHSFFSSSEPGAFDLGVLNPEESKSVVFTQTGTVRVYCSLHAGKQLTLLVAPTPYSAPVQTDGTFVFARLSPGDYVLEVRGDDLRSERRRVSLSRGERVPLLLEVDSEPAKGAE